ncbi:hypothetical protein [Nocardia cyriacigeorgica]|uniref:hypothetical protein n=1 Tax=Nocardia cyriacigeorgica TaxID=135487 RepID=UPI0024557BCF|nr:hypothetical protein [Nocardia cyriacigeorgica]
MADLASAASGGSHLEILKALRTRLIVAMDDASPGVMPQYAKQISDISREIAELEPVQEEANDVDEFADAFASAE